MSTPMMMMMHRGSNNNNSGNHRWRNASKIIKGEIHNVLTIMRSDPRYYSTSSSSFHHGHGGGSASGTSGGGSSSSRGGGGSTGSSNNVTKQLLRGGIQSRFEYEERRHATYFRNARFWGESTPSSVGEDASASQQQAWGSGTTISSHPILEGFRNLHDLLSVMEAEGNSFATIGGSGLHGRSGGVGSSGSRTLSSSSAHKTQRVTAVTFIAPFAAAVQSAEVDAKTTAEALSAMHKFIVYGFIGGHSPNSAGMMMMEDDDNNHYNNYDSAVVVSGSGAPYNFPFTSSESAVRESISLVARCIRQCSFDDVPNSSRKNLTSPLASTTSRFSFWSSDDGGGKGRRTAHGKSIFGDEGNNSGDYDEDGGVKLLPSFLTRSRRSGRSSAQGKSGTPINNTSTSSSSSSSSSYRASKSSKCSSSSSSILYSALTPSDEDVLLKLLSLSVQVLRCPAGRDLLHPRDVVGIFDTCCHIAIAAGETKGRSLLRSAAAEALSHVVIVVFGTRGGGGGGSSSNSGQQQRSTKKLNANSSTNNLPDDYTDGDATDNATTESSDDDWGERDPTLEDDDYPLEDVVLIKRRRNPVVKKPLIRPSRNESPLGEDQEEDQEEKKKENDNTKLQGGEDEPALVAITHRLATLADPLLHMDDTCVLALSLVNIALETILDVDALSVRYPRLLSIMQNDLCRNLLRLSTSADLTILGLALRVIFNLFNSIKDHLKVQLEVFLTSVHLRTLAFTTNNVRKEKVWSSPPERRELALESLLEFCREPMLMADLYLNYDCDINCTNLFETICGTLAKVANPEVESAAAATGGGGGGGRAKENDGERSQREYDGESSGEEDAVATNWQKPRLSILNRLALEGLLAVIDAIARRCRASSKYKGIVQSDDKAPSNSKEAPCSTPSPPDAGNSAFLGNTLYINNNNNNIDDPMAEDSGSINDSSEYDFCTVSTSSAHRRTNAAPPPDRLDSEMSEGDIEWLSKARYHTSLALRERKLRKRRLAKAAAEFNERPRDREWIDEAERLGVLPSPAAPGSVASFLYSTPKLDKAKIGLYLSKGPSDRYPFHARVLERFASLFDFSGISFSGALRTFLGRFRLPGEAQCIDRLMEAFATRLYEVQKLSESSVAEEEDGNDQSVEKTMGNPPLRQDTSEISSEYSGRSSSGMLDPPAASDVEVVDPVFPFKSSDAAFILSFSTIMLNTDLHNPNMKDEKRMTLDQFIRNNRGINDGADLPIDFLTDLYYEIKNEEIQVNQDLLQAGGADAFDGILAKANDVATPFFTSNHSAHNKFVQAGVHERDMYVSISSAAINAIATVFVESWDDVLVTKALDGLQNAAYICSYFELNEQFNQILELLLGFGLDYVGSVTTLIYTAGLGLKNSEANGPKEDDNQMIPGLEAELVARGIPNLPKSLLSTLNADSGSPSVHFDISDMAGSAAHRGLLSLQCALTLGKRHLTLVREAWPMFLEVIFALRDVKSLPPGLSDLDDFADSRGNPLPMSVFANQSQQRVNEDIQSMVPSDTPDTGFLSSIFGFGHPSLSHEKEVQAGNTQTQFPLSETLQKVTQLGELNKIIMKTSDVAMAKRILIAMLSSMFPDDDDEETTSDPLFEHNSVFVLELAARLLISNRIHAAELYPIFLNKFKQLITPQMGTNASPEYVILGLKFPYILERIVVTILRACIHLFDVPDVSLREQLNRSLNLIATLPSSYTSTIGDRIGCGAAIILRGCFYLFDDSSDDWSTIKSLLDLAAQDKSGRGFVFDGIASVIDGIDYAIPSARDAAQGQNGDDINNEVQLSQCGVEVMASLLLKFMNGSYQDDLSYKVPSMMYLNKVYSFSKHFSDKALAKNGSSDSSAHLQEHEFEKMVTAIYNDACLAQDGATSKKGFEALQGLVLSTKVDSIPVAKWFAFLELVANKPPSIASQEARECYLSFVGRLFLALVPELSNNKENWSQLEEWTISVASIVSDNLQAGRATPLFETTVQTVTNIVNVMSMTGFNEGNGVNFCAWVGETLLYELEKVGACGGATSMMMASTRRRNSSK